MAERKVRYIAPGHTQVRYAHRILDIRFKETESAFKRKLKNRDAHRASGPYKNSPTVKTVKLSKAPTVKAKKPKTAKEPKPFRYTDTEEYKIRKLKDDYRMMKNREDLETGRYTKEDMRALLKDSHWEEYCGHSRWKFDDRSLVKEFQNYLMHNKGMYRPRNPLLPRPKKHINTICVIQ